MERLLKADKLLHLPRYLFLHTHNDLFSHSLRPLHPLLAVPKRLIKNLSISKINYLLQSFPHNLDHKQGKQTRLYDACVDPLIDSLADLGEWTREFKRNHLEEIRNKELNGVI